jgi:hypothetical protein
VDEALAFRLGNCNVFPHTRAETTVASGDLELLERRKFDDKLESAAVAIALVFCEVFGNHEREGRVRKDK